MKSNLSSDKATHGSTIEKNKQLVRSFAEDVFNRHDLAAVDKYMTGADSFKRYLGEYFAGHPDSHTTIDQIIAEGDNAVSFTLRTSIS